jgi:hypothetical protein
MLEIFGDRLGSPVAGLEHSQALTSARALLFHAPRRSCAIRIEGGGGGSCATVLVTAH